MTKHVVQLKNKVYVIFPIINYYKDKDIIKILIVYKVFRIKSVSITYNKKLRVNYISRLHELPQIMKLVHKFKNLHQSST